MPRETITLHPAGPYYVGRIILYLALVLAPLALTAWLEDSLLPTAARATWRGIIPVVLLPLLYGGLYLALRRIGARSQNFLLLVILLFAIIGGSGWYRAIEGQGTQWPIAILGTAYVVGFSLLIARTGRAERRVAEQAACGEREAMIDIQAEAILRAKELERQRSGRT